MLLAPDFLLLAALLHLHLLPGALLLLFLSPLGGLSVTSAALLLPPLLLGHLPLPVRGLPSAAILLVLPLPLQVRTWAPAPGCLAGSRPPARLRAGAGGRRAAAAAVAAANLEPQGLVHGAIPGNLPAAQRRGVGGLVAIVGPDLVAAHLGPEPPAAEAGAVALVPEVDQHADAARGAVLLVHRPAVVGALHGVGPLDDVGHRLVAAAIDSERRGRSSAAWRRRPWSAGGWAASGRTSKGRGPRGRAAGARTVGGAGRRPGGAGPWRVGCASTG
mmetsp:Transcript_87147/g.255069  ORF Transcript_87147/g.255069 Transcript_87147/m.255069 type:complete len:274 (-) Transcript_87147:193-1014(-)